MIEYIPVYCMNNYNYNYTRNGYKFGDYKYEENNLTIIDVITLTIGLWFMGYFLEGFKEHLRQPHNDDDDGYGMDLFDWMMFLD